MKDVLLTKNSDLIQYFVDVIESKDQYTQGHSHHVKAVVNAIIDCLPKDYHGQIDKEKLLMAALLHDVGKIRATPRRAGFLHRRIAQIAGAVVDDRDRHRPLPGSGNTPMG